MAEQPLKTLDLITNPDAELWNRCLDVIYKGTDPLRENYLNIDFNDYLSFPVVVNNDRIVCFSGLQYSEKKWGRGIARASSRMWIHPAYRHSGITKFVGGTKFLNTTYCLPIQFAVALNSNIDAMFISRESNLLAFQQYLKLVKINCNYIFNLLPNFYNVCGPQAAVPESCRQYVALHYLTKQAPATWAKSMNQYQLDEFEI